MVVKKMLQKEYRLKKNMILKEFIHREKPLLVGQ